MTTLPQIRDSRERLDGELGLVCDCRQTSHQGVMIDSIQEAFEKDAGLIVNPASLSFGAIPILDVLKLIQWSLIEVHFTNIHRRGAQYQHSLVSLVATRVICGLGANGYLLALRAIVDASNAWQARDPT